MLVPAPRARVGFAVLVTAVGGSLLLSAGTSSSATAPVGPPFYGPVAAAPAETAPHVAPLLRTNGPLLASPSNPSLIPVRRPVGPAAAAPAAPPPGARAGVASLAGARPGAPAQRVRALQRLLNARGAHLRVDGAWGPATTCAVERLQARAGLPVDGRLGPRTLALLQADPALLHTVDKRWGELHGCQ